MIRPLDLEALDGLVAGLTLRLVEDAARMFFISQVLLHLDHIMLHFADRVLEASTELRHVEHVVDLGEVRRQFKTVCHGSTPGKNTERANVARSHLALDTEAMSAPHGSDTKVSVFTRLILHFPVFPVIVALLMGLSGLQVSRNDVNLIFSLLNNIRANECTFPSF